MRKAVGLLAVILATGGCGGSAEPDPTPPPAPTLATGAVTTSKPAVILWETSRGMAGQVIVSVENVSIGWVDLWPSTEGESHFGSPSSVTIRTKDGALVTGTEAGSVEYLNAYPSILAPGESGYLVAEFDYSDVEAADVVVGDVEFVFAPADPLDDTDRPEFGKFKVAKVRDSDIEVSSSVDLGETSSNYVGVAYNKKGKVLGFVEQWTLDRTGGSFTLCCLPPKVAPKTVAEVSWAAN